MPFDASSTRDSRANSFARARSLIVTLAVVVVASLLVGRAQAADPVAESLFQEALEMMKAGNFAAACPKMRASHDREPKSGTLIMLASCYEQVGMTASAWAEYKEAGSLARTEGRQENADKAAGLAAAVEARLSRLRIEVTPGTEGLTVQLDDSLVPPASFGTAAAVDPGEHVLTASAPGHVDWSTTVVVGPDGDAQTVTIPVLEAAAPEPAAAVALPPPPPPMPPPPPRDSAGQEGGTPTWAWIVGGVGVAFTIAAVIFRIDQSAAASELDDRCGAERLACPADYDFQSDRSREELDFGLFVGFGAAGLVSIGAALVGIATAPADGDDTALQLVPWLAPGSAGGALTLRF